MLLILYQMKSLNKLFTASIFTILLLGSNQAFAQFQNINPADFASIVKKEKAIVVDVRTEGEVSEGFIKGTTVFANVNSPDFNNKIKSLDPNKSYIVYCRSGARSSRASEIMVKQGFKKVYNLNGGIMGWPGEITKP